MRHMRAAGERREPATTRPADEVSPDHGSTVCSPRQYAQVRAAAISLAGVLLEQSGPAAGQEGVAWGGRRAWSDAARAGRLRCACAAFAGTQPSDLTQALQAAQGNLDQFPGMHES